APEDKSIYFRGGGLWQQLCSQEHNDESTVRHRGDKLVLKFSPGLGDALFKNLSRLRFDEPVYYGLFKKHVYIIMFGGSADIRLTPSPSGRGVNTKQQPTNPAWDFQYIIPKYEVRKEYGFRARVVYRERCDRAEVLREYENWTRSQKS